MGNVGGTKKNWVMTFGRFNAQGGRHHNIDAQDMQTGMDEREAADFLRQWLKNAYEINDVQVSVAPGKVTMGGHTRHGVKWYGEAETFG
jgi:hypothetical protein